MSRRSIGLLGLGADPVLGGVPTHVRALERHLGERGWRVHRLALDPAPERAPLGLHRARRGSGSESSCAYRYADHASWHDLSEHPLTPRVVRAWLARARPDLVHVHHLTGFGWGVLEELARHGVGVVMTLHDYASICPRGQLFAWDDRACDAPEPARCAPCLARTWPHLEPGAGGAGGGGPEAVIGARLERARALLARVDRLVVPSAAALEPFALAGIDLGHARVVEHGIEAAELGAEVAALRRRRPGRAALVLGVLGTVQPTKGVGLLARALASADLDGAPPVELEIHGPTPDYHGDPSERRALVRLAERDPRIRLAGPYEPSGLARVLSRLDAVAAPSRWREVFGLGVREARAAGLGVLVSDSGGLPTAVSGDRGGLVVRAAPGRELEAWRAALERWAGDAELRARWAADPPAVREARDMARELEELYLEVLERRNANP